VLEQLSTSDIYISDNVHDLSRMANDSKFKWTRQKQLFPIFENIVVDAGLDENGNATY